MLPGRHVECARLNAPLAGVREHRGAALVIRGEPGIGKSALLDRAGPVRVLRAYGVESEVELPFAAPHQLFHQATAEPDLLPQSAALGLPSPDHQPATERRFLVAVGVLGELSTDVRGARLGGPATAHQIDAPLSTWIPGADRASKAAPNQ
ncbi:AAA ATPase domain-containing protein [Nonomuraea solani]|uniref:AAA ATPase domain-containing protein n=2 Tax=Nonomuraea solani TaxID=1144553 RepID=A0A1H5VQ74_9ACTN|nr:AAA ATPase domain-containing protein [Nonomuraea solani]